MAIMGEWEVFTANGGSQEWGDGKFLKSLNIVDRGVLTPLFYEDPTILPIPPFQMLSTPKTSVSHSTPASTVLSVDMFL